MATTVPLKLQRPYGTKWCEKLERHVTPSVLDQFVQTPELWVDPELGDYYDWCGNKRICTSKYGIPRYLEEGHYVGYRNVWETREYLPEGEVTREKLCGFHGFEMVDEEHEKAVRFMDTCFFYDQDIVPVPVDGVEDVMELAVVLPDGGIRYIL